jgi:hypothetical protein
MSLITALMMEAVRTSETSVNIYLTTRRYIPEDSKLQTETFTCDGLVIVISCYNVNMNMRPNFNCEIQLLLNLSTINVCH